MSEVLPVLSRILPAYQVIKPAKVVSQLPIVFLHGFLGSKMNFKRFAHDFKMQRAAYILDARNHGASSPHCLPMNYEVLTNDLEEFVNKVIYVRKKRLSDEEEPVMPDYTTKMGQLRVDYQGKIDLVGYSMGAKTAMNYTLRHPDKVRRLVVIDNAPISQSIDDQIKEYIDSVKQVKIYMNEKLKSKPDSGDWKITALEKFKQLHPDNINICYYLLNTLQKSKNHIVYTNAEMLFEDPSVIEELGRFPQHHNPFLSKVIFIKAKKSDMINGNGIKEINRLFPNNEIFEFDSDHESLLIENHKEIVKIARGYMAD